MTDDEHMLMCLAEYLRSVDKDAVKAFDYASKVDELRHRIAANGAEPVAWQSPSGWLYDDNPNGFADWTPLYAAPVSSGPRYDWTVSGTKQSDTGNWVMAEKGDKE